jgi:hypothetical protein
LRILHVLLGLQYGLSLFEQRIETVGE